MKWLFLVLLGVLVSFRALPQNADINLLKEINVGRNQSWDPTFRFISNTVTPITIGIPVALITYTLIKKDSVSKSKATVISSSVLLAAVLSTSLKHAVNRDRPDVTYPLIQKATSSTSASFPSGHTSAAFSLATSLSISYPRWYIITTSYLWASAVGYSRMHLGVHYPSDVLAAAIIGSGSAILSYKLNRWIRGKHKYRR